MNFKTIIIESTYVLMDIYGYNNKKVEEFAKVVRKYDKGKATKRDVKNTFEKLISNQTTNKKTLEKIAELLYFYTIEVWQE